jgi:inosose dehydratase
MIRSRRRFIAGLGSATGAAFLPIGTLGALSSPLPLYPPANLSYFDKPITAAPGEIRFGYAAITWEENDLQAIKDISETGFRGIQLRSNILPEFGKKPKAIAEILAQHNLQFVALSGGGPKGRDYNEKKAIETQVRNATFLRDAGGLYLQMTDSARPKRRPPTTNDFRKLGRVLTEVGKRTVDLGIPMAYHNHMRSVGESPAEVDALMEATDERYVKLLLDVAHYTQGGGDPAQAIRQYRDRILFLHIKDVESTRGESKSGAQSFRFVELGRGRVDLSSVFHALSEIQFRGWAVVELDNVPDKSRSPRDCAVINKKYIEEKIGLKV